MRARCESFTGFLREAWHVLEPETEYIRSWHHDAIGEHLEAVTRGEIRRLQINQPPGTMKSLNVSVMFGAWEWGPANRPGLRYLTTSYTETYARRDSRRMRDLIQSEWYRTLWPEIVLTRDNEMDFENTYKGNRRAMPFSSLTSGRGNRVIIDDPHSTETVESDADREKVTRRFRESVTSRLNNQRRDTIIVIMHRLHPQDVCGVIDELALPYTKLVLPMEYVRSLVVKTPFFTDPRREDGELLCPEQVPRETLEGMKIELGPHAYDTQFQQQPRAREGSYFFSREMILVEHKAPGGSTYEPCDKPRLCDAVFAVVDTATKVGKSRDGTGVMWVAYTKHPKPGAIILGWDIVQIEADLLIRWLPDVMRTGEQFAKECNARMGWQGALIEDKDSGQILLQGARRAGMKVHAIDTKWANAGKDGRAVSAGGYVRRGLMKMSREAYDKTMPWKGRVANHALLQITTFRVGIGTQNDSDELFDCFTYSNLAAFGDAKEL